MSPRAIFPVAAGVCLVVFGFHLRTLSLRSAAWSVTRGVITDSQWLTRTKNDREVKTRADIRYRYTVNGQSYKGDLISYGDLFFASDDDRLQRYPQGATVDVHYDPNDPRLAVLEPGRGKAPGLLILGGLGLFGFAIWRDRR